MSSIDTAASLPPSQPPSSQLQSSEPASQASADDDTEGIKQFKDDMQAEKKKWLGSTSVDKRKGLASKWYLKLVGKEEGSSLPIHIRNDIQRSAQEAEVKGKEDVWDELVVFLYWQKKIADAKRPGQKQHDGILLSVMVESAEESAFDHNQVSSV